MRCHCRTDDGFEKEALTFAPNSGPNVMSEALFLECRNGQAQSGGINNRNSAFS